MARRGWGRLRGPWCLRARRPSTSRTWTPAGCAAGTTRAALAATACPSPAASSTRAASASAPRAPRLRAPAPGSTCAGIRAAWTARVSPTVDGRWTSVSSACTPETPTSGRPVWAATGFPTAGWKRTPAGCAGGAGAGTRTASRSRRKSGRLAATAQASPTARTALACSASACTTHLPVQVSSRPTRRSGGSAGRRANWRPWRFSRPPGPCSRASRRRPSGCPQRGKSTSTPLASS